MCYKIQIGEEIIERYQSSLSFLMKAKDIRPTEKTLVISYNGKVNFSNLSFGLSGKSLLINARLETIQEKPSFRNLKRCIIPARAFYEKDYSRMEHRFYQKEPILFLAGLCNEKEFVVITTKANASMNIYHDRMPFILPKKQADAWLLKKDISNFVPLEVYTTEKQISLF